MGDLSDVEFVPTAAVDIVESCGAYATDGRFELHVEVADADAALPDATSSVTVYLFLTSPANAALTGEVGGEGRITEFDEDGVRPLCPDNAATVTRSANTYRVVLPAGCLSVDQVIGGVEVQVRNSDSSKGSGDSGGQLAVPRGATFAPPADPDGVIRLAGPTRIETAVEISRQLFDDAGAEIAVVATAGNFADAQTATPLVGQGRGGALLLSGPDGLHPATAAELTRVLTPGAQVYLVGGTAVLSDQVVDDVAALGFDVVRLAGVGRGETSVQIAEEVTDDPTHIFFVDGSTFPPGILAGSVAGRLLDAVVVSGQAGAEYIDRHPEAEAVQIGDSRFTADVDMVITAPTPALLSVAVADAFSDSFQDGLAALASADDFPDGLAGSAHAAARSAPLYLTPADNLASAIDDTLDGDDITRLYVYGGGAAISTDVTAQALDLADPRPDGPLTIRQDGLGLVPFGTDADATILAVSEVLGQPANDSGWGTGGGPIGCGPERRFVTWPGLSVYFGRGGPTDGFQAYFAGTPLSTSTGIRAGSTLAELQAAHPDVTVTPLTGEGVNESQAVWVDGTTDSTPSGPLSAFIDNDQPGPDDTLSTIFVEACP